MLVENGGCGGGGGGDGGGGDDDSAIMTFVVVVVGKRDDITVVAFVGCWRFCIWFVDGKMCLIAVFEMTRLSGNGGSGFGDGSCDVDGLATVVEW